MHVAVAPAPPEGTPKATEGGGRDDRGPGSSCGRRRGARSPRSWCGSSFFSSRGSPGCEVTGQEVGGHNPAVAEVSRRLAGGSREEGVLGGGGRGASVTRSFTPSLGTEGSIPSVGFIEPLINATSFY